MTHRLVPARGPIIGGHWPTGLLAGGPGGVDEGLEVPKETKNLINIFVSTEWKIESVAILLDVFDVLNYCHWTVLGSVRVKEIMHHGKILFFVLLFFTKPTFGLWVRLSYSVKDK